MRTDLVHKQLRCHDGDGAGIGIVALGRGNNVCGAVKKGREVNNNNIGDNNLFFLFFDFETILITGEEPRRSDFFNRIVVEVEKETYGKDTLSSGNASSSVMRRTGLKSACL